MNNILDCKSTVQESLLFWIEKYMKYKINVLSRRDIKDVKALNSILDKIKGGVTSIEELEFYMKSIRKLGLAGTNVYFIIMKKFYDYISNIRITSLKQIDEEFLAEFLYEVTCTMSDATKKNHRMIIVNFFNYLDKKSETKFNIELFNWAGVRGKSGVKLPKFMKDEEISLFFKALKKYKRQSKRNVKFSVLLELLLRTGMRVSEVLNIRLNDIMDDNKFYMIKIIGKGNKERVVMIKKILLKSYLSTKSKKEYISNEFLFLSKSGNILTQPVIHYHMKAVLGIGKIKTEKKGPHLLRHTFATRLYKTTKDIVLVQEFLGHEDINTTRVYTHLDSDRLSLCADAMDEFHID